MCGWMDVLASGLNRGEGRESVPGILSTKEEESQTVLDSRHAIKKEKRGDCGLGPFRLILTCGCDSGRKRQCQ